MPQRRRPILATALLLNSVAVFIMWPVMLAGGAFPHGLMSYQPEGTIPILHLIAEFLMSGVTLTGATGLWAGAKWGEKLTLFGLGMFTYSSINSLGWALHNEFLMGVPMIVMIMLTVFAVPELLFERSPWQADEVTNIR